jgi:hypothetical protein
MLNLAFFSEKIAHQGCTFVGKHSFCKNRLFVEWVFAEQMIAAFGVVGAPDHAAYLAPSECGGTHQARLHSDVERAINQIFTAKIARRGSYGLHFGMSGDVGEGFGEVVSTSDYCTAAQNHSPDRHLVGLSRLVRLVEGDAHVAFVEIIVDFIHGSKRA